MNGVNDLSQKNGDSNGGKCPKGSKIDEETRLVLRAKPKAQRTTNKEKEKSRGKPKAPAAGVQKSTFYLLQIVPIQRDIQSFKTLSMSIFLSHLSILQKIQICDFVANRKLTIPRGSHSCQTGSCCAPPPA